MTYLEQALHDPELRAFIDASVARAWVELSALRVEAVRQAEIIQHQAEQIRSLTEASKGKGKK